ncbi:MAG: outer membrane lipoprotein-sorting protein [Candidatus Margulisbacteria bacterium]|nr:outer membrane lipoprotein-sorting protein [Candidatus Margulisiibacteriota bacterium]
MAKKICLIAAALVLTASFALASNLSLDDLVNKLQSNQSKINDMYAETVTTITSNMAMPGAEGRGPQKMVQKGKMWTKGENKSKIEMLTPMKQTTITNGDKMLIINSETGQKMVQDLKEMRKKAGGVAGSGGQQMGLAKAKEYFNLSVSQKGGNYVITGIPKEANKFLAKMEFYIDSSKWIPTKVLMYGPQNKLISQSNIEYQKISDVWVPVKNISDVTTPAGKMKIEMEFNNIKINRGISDNEFKID